MERSLKRTLCLILFSLTCLWVHGAVLAEDAEKAEKTLVGEYHWNRGETGDLKGVFTSTGEGTWDVTFYFDFRDKSRVYKGTAKGSMDGSLSGEVIDENKKRSFNFEGAFSDGVFEGNHAELTPKRAVETGTLILRLGS